jgi:hypothetical protein
MNPEQVIMASANAGAATVGTNLFVSLTNKALQLMGRSLEQHLDDGDTPGVLSPADVVRDGKDRVGCVLVLADRVIIAWTEGTFRIRTSETVLQKTSISAVETGVRPGGAMQKPRETLTITADGTWQLVFANMFEGGRSIVPFLKGLIDGSVTPQWDAPQA